MPMKRIEKFVLILSIVTFIKVSTVPFITSVLKPLMLSAPSEAAAKAVSSFGWISSTAFILTNLVCGILLFIESKEEKLSRWVWLLFGLTFGLEAVIMFYLYMIFIEIRLKWKRSDESAS
jgi:hypothetical protein